MPWKKGQSGNPGGFSKEARVVHKAIEELAREHTGDALKTLVEICKDRQAPMAARVSAATEILNRGHGKSKQSLTVDGKLTLEQLIAASFAEDPAQK